MEAKDLTDFTDSVVKHRTAKNAREKGFYCVTPHRFLNENKIIGGWIGNAIPKPTEEDIHRYLSSPDELLIAPTKGVLHEWLKKFHNISVHTEPVYSGNPENGVMFSAYLFVGKKQRIDFTNVSVEESDAFESGLNEALKQIP